MSIYWMINLSKFRDRFYFDRYLISVIGLCGANFCFADRKNLADEDLVNPSRHSDFNSFSLATSFFNREIEAVVAFL